MKKEKEVIEEMVIEDAVIYRDLRKDIIFFRLVNGLKVKEYSLKLFEYLKEKGIIIIKQVGSFHSEYKIVSKAKREKLGIKI